MSRRLARRPGLAAIAVLAAAIGGCSPAAPPSSAGIPGASDSAAASAAVVAARSQPASATASPSLSAISRPSLRPSASPAASLSARAWDGVVHDPRKFGFAAKQMSHEVMAFVTVGQIPYARTRLDFDAISTLAFFSVEANRNGAIARDRRFEIWSSPAVDELIDRAHDHGTNVVISLSRFSWSPGQTAVSRAILQSPERRARLAREVAAEVARRGIDGVNVDFEPIPIGQEQNFTSFVRTLRTELDAVGPGYQLTFAVTGHHESYDVAAVLRPGGADAVYLMGYHFAGTFSKIAASTAPMGGPRYDVVDTVKLLLKAGRPEQIIVRVPYYGHLWPTASGAMHASTVGKGFDVPYEQAVEIAAAHGSRYDRVEQVSWSAYRVRPCKGCALQWRQMYFDDPRSLGHKWDYIKKQGLLGTGIWTIGFEGRPGDLDTALRAAFLAASS